MGEIFVYYYEGKLSERAVKCREEYKEKGKELYGWGIELGRNKRETREWKGYDTERMTDEDFGELERTLNFLEEEREEIKVEIEELNEWMDENRDYKNEHYVSGYCICEVPRTWKDVWCAVKRAKWPQTSVEITGFLKIPYYELEDHLSEQHRLRGSELWDPDVSDYKGETKVKKDRLREEVDKKLREIIPMCKAEDFEKYLIESEEES